MQIKVTPTKQIEKKKSLCINVYKWKILIIYKSIQGQPNMFKGLK